MSDKPSDKQEAWQDIAFRLRMQISRSLDVTEHLEAKGTDDESMRPDAMEKLASTSWSVFMLERQAANMDRMMQREGGWN